jgi:hypothetical protein
MGYSSAKGASIEGEKVDLQTRQFHAYPPKKDVISNQRHFGFRLAINGQAEISESYSAPDEACVYSTSLVCVGDKIAGESVHGWALKALGRPNVSKGSAAHSATFLSVSGGCFAMVAISPREQLESKDFQTRDPEVTPVHRIA